MFSIKKEATVSPKSSQEKGYISLLRRQSSMTMDPKFLKYRMTTSLLSEKASGKSPKG
jgi:hypothetical protein